MPSPNREHSTSGETNIPVSLSQWARRLLIPLTILAWAAVVYALFQLLGQMAQALLLLLIGALIAYMIYPLAHLFTRIMPRFLAILLVYLLIFTGIGGLLYIVSEIVVEQVTSLIQYIQSLIISGVPEKGQLYTILRTLQRIGITQNQLLSSSQQALRNWQAITTNAFFVISHTFSFLLNTFLITMLSVYFLYSGPKITGWLRTHTPLPQREQVIFLIDTMQRVIGGYIRGTVILATIFSVLTGIGVALIGVPYPFLLAVLAFLLEFIPFVGVYITGAILVMLALTQSWLTALLALGLFVLLQNLENNVLSPRIVGGAVGINPIINIFAVIAGAHIFGIAGALFAAPVAGLLQALLQAVWSWWHTQHPEQFPEEEYDQCKADKQNRK